MRIEDQLRERLRKVEALFYGAATEGEREAAGAAAERLKAKLDEARRRDAPVELKFVMPDQWSVRLFIALCRRYGFKPFLCAPAPHDGHGQGAAPAFQRGGVAQFCELHDDLWAYLDETTGRVIRETIHADAADAETAPERLA
jgi:hypothetical protein